MWITMWISSTLVCKNISGKILRSANECVYALLLIYYTIILSPVIIQSGKMWDKVVKRIPIDTHRFSIPHTHQKRMERLTPALGVLLCINFVWYQIRVEVRIV